MIRFFSGNRRGASRHRMSGRHIAAVRSNQEDAGHPIAATNASSYRLRSRFEDDLAHFLANSRMSTVQCA